MPATDLEKLVVQLSVDIKAYQRDLQKAMGVTNQQAKAIENRFRQTNRVLDTVGRGMATSLVGPLSGIAAAASVVEVAKYADAWTAAGNKLAASSTIAGRQARSLEEVNRIATDTRSGITATVDLYSKLLRSTARVAKSEDEVAKATEIVNKAFKAGGAATSEQVAGILQLSQALGSGLLQGDELRSVRENAPLLAQAIADEFKTTIAGLKDLGATGQLTTDRVFKAILQAGPKIEVAFNQTSSTIFDGVIRVNNALTQYVGQTNAGLGASQRLIEGLNALADNFDTVADTVLQVAAILAGALVGRGIASIVKGFGVGTAAIVTFTRALASVRTVSAATLAVQGLGAAAGPVGFAIGTVAAGAMVALAARSAEAEKNLSEVNEELIKMGIRGPEAAKGIDEVAKSQARLKADDVRKIAAFRAELERIKGGGNPLSDLGDELGNIAGQAEGFTKGLVNLFSSRSKVDTSSFLDISRMARGFADGSVKAQEIYDHLKAIGELPVSQEVIDLADKLKKTVEYAEQLQLALAAKGDTTSLQEANQELDKQRQKLRELGQTWKTSRKQFDTLDAIVESWQRFGVSAEITKDRLKEVAGTNINAIPVVNELIKIIDTIVRLQEEADTAAKKLKGLALGPVFEGGRAAGFTRISESEKATKFADDQVKEAQRSEADIRLDETTKRIMKAADEVGIAIEETAARILAAKVIATEDLTKATTSAVSSATELIKKFEGFRSTPYWDQNAFRVGFGSDTVTLSDGSIQKVVQGMTVTLADANRDLERRVAEFQKGIESKIGTDTFRSMNEAQQAALTSIAYNYGSLPQRIVEAIKTGNVETVYNAIKDLGNDNGGINRRRRQEEADMFVSGAASSITQGIQSKEDFEQTLADHRAYLASLQEETAIRATLNPLINDYGKAMSTVEAAQYLLTAAQKEGTAAGLELSGVQQLLYGDLSKLTPEARAQAEAMRELALKTGEAEAAANQLKEQQNETAASMENFAGFAKDVLGGFIRDLRDGKSATEALGNALEKIGDKLLDLALNALFDSFTSSGGGFLGAIAGALGFAKGGYTGDGAPDEVAGTVHKGEYVFSKKAVDAIGVKNLDDMHRYLKGYREGGLVTNRPHIPGTPRYVSRKENGSGVTLNYSPMVDARGASVEAVERLERSMVKERAQLESRVITIVRQARSERKL